MKLYGPGERQFVRLFRLLRVEGGGLLLWRRARCSVLAGFLKHRREKFYARPCYTTARTHARTHVRAFFLVVCHRGARDLSLFRRF